MKKLLIVESPAKIKTISKFLGKDFVIMSTIGHIKDLPTRTLGVTIPEKGEIKINYVVMENKDKVITDIVKEAKKCDAVFLAPDPDREGEIIAWHIGQEIEKVLDPNKIFRITFNEITKSAISEAVKHPSHIDLQKVAAQQARRILDRWVGYEVSPVLWRKITKGLSAGRVQSVALKLICDREQAIRDFKIEEYWTIDGLFGHNKATFLATLAQVNDKKIDINNEQKAKELVDQIKKAEYIIESIQDKTRSKKPYAPFMTSTLQQTAYNRLGFSVKKTMEVAQKLYEGIPLEDPNAPIALITYMRTDSLRISDTAIQQSREFIEGQYGKKYLPKSTNVYAKKKGNAQDAHEAIRPVDISLSPDKVKPYLTADAAKLYELIWRRFVACQMESAEYAQRQVTIQGDKFTFKVTGSTLIFDGFLKVYAPEEEDKEATVVLPAEIKEKDKVKLEKVEPKQHFTQPPARYTEASLVKELEKEGIGRPSTYATIMNTIRARSYTKLDTKKRFEPTELGFAVTKMLNTNLPKIMDIKFTAHMEEDLDKIAHGELERDLVLREFWKDFQKDLKEFKGTATKMTETTDIVCPECKQHNLIIRFGKSGQFLGCPGYPECKFTTNFTRDESGKIQMVEKQEAQILDQTCPKCGKPLRLVRGRFGEFKACSGYPECKYIHQETAGFKCPSCKKGDIIKRKWKRGSFWGCSNYPKCKFAIFGEIVEKPCPKCKLPFLVREKDKIRCSDTSCGYTEVGDQA